MKTITIHVPEETYRMFQKEAAKANKSASELIRNAMDEYREQHFIRSGSIFDGKPADVGEVLKPLSPDDDLLEEMLP